MVHFQYKVSLEFIGDTDRREALDPSPRRELVATYLRILRLEKLRVVCYMTESTIGKGEQSQAPNYSLDKALYPNQ